MDLMRSMPSLHDQRLGLGLTGAWISNLTVPTTQSFSSDPPRYEALRIADTTRKL